VDVAEQGVAGLAFHVFEEDVLFASIAMKRFHGGPWEKDKDRPEPVSKRRANHALGGSCGVAQTGSSDRFT